MFTGDAYSVRAIEYLTCGGFLVAFTFFWRFVWHDPVPAPVTARARAHQFGFFHVPEGVHVHSGHGWAKADVNGVLTMGSDDFAQQLVGPVSGVVLPQVGDHLRQGRPAWGLDVDGAIVEMLSPVSGTVVQVNQALEATPAAVNTDPYGDGWLVKLAPDAADEELSSLMSGQAARRWIEQVSETLVGTMSPELGALCQDGGHPVQGLARAIDERNWQAVTRRFLLS